MRRRTRVAWLAGALLLLAFAGREVLERTTAPPTAGSQGPEHAIAARVDAAQVGSAPAAAARRTRPDSTTTDVRAGRSAAPSTISAADRCHADREAALERFLALQPAPATAQDAVAEASLHSPVRVALFDAALRRWPEDVDAAWMAWEFCSLSTDCNHDARVRHLLEVDGDNAYAWLAALDAATARGDAGGVAVALRRAASAPVYDDRAGTVYLLVRPLLAELPLPESCRHGGLQFLHEMIGREPTAADVADIVAHSYEMGLSGAGYSLNDLCDARQQPLPRARKRDCIAVLRRMVASDALNVRHAALRSLIRLLDLQDSAPLREQLRQLLWVMEVMAAQQDHFGPMLGGQFWSKGEVPAYEAIARKEGLWPPPPQWLPDAPHERRLILEGR